MKLFYFCLLVFGAAVEAAHRDKFRSCETSHFCSRNRNQNGKEEDDNENRISAALDYELDRSSVKVSRDGFSALLQPTNDGVSPPDALLRMEISRVIGSVVRVHITEDNPLRYRYLVKDALSVSGRVALPFDDFESGLEESELRWGALSVRIEYGGSFWRVVVMRDGMVEMTVNAHNLFHFEYQRTQRSDDDPSEWWETSFGGHTYYHDDGPASIGLDVAFNTCQHLFGIPEHAMGFSLTDTVDAEPYRLWNLDVFEYQLNVVDSLYGAIPFVFAHSAEHNNGLLWLNAAETYVDIGTDDSDNGVRWSRFLSESGAFEAFLIVGDAHPQSVLRQYGALTASPQMPPLFSIGHHQCRWNYISESDVASINDRLIEWDVPTDVIWLDIEHTDGKRYFTWDAHNFPTPNDMLAYVAQFGRRMVTIVDPHIKEDSNYYIYSDIESRDLWVKTRDGDSYGGWCWPGDSRYPDFLHPQMQQFWAEQLAFDKYQYSSPNLFVWNDMNEPSVFNGPELTMAGSNIHYNHTRHATVHNLYGYYVHRATFDGLMQRTDNRMRPFVLSRAFFVGSQKYGAIWTGDNTADWEHLRISVPMLLSMGISGLPFVGADIGGFFGDPDGELMARWYELGAYYPFFRNHAHQDTKRRELWEFDDEYALRMKAAIVRRYQLLPYLYTCFYHSHLTTEPILRPLWFDFPTDHSTFDRDDAFMFGDSILVAPIYEAGVTSVDVQLPIALWYNRLSPSSPVLRGGTHSLRDCCAVGIPEFQKGGSIVAEKHRIRRSSQLMQFDPYTVFVALDENGFSHGSLYIDDGVSFDFVRRRSFSTIDFTFENCTLSNRIQHNEFDDFNPSIEKIVILSDAFAPIQSIRVGSDVSIDSFHQTGNSIEIKIQNLLTVNSLFHMQLIAEKNCLLR